MHEAGILAKLKEKYFRFLRENNCDPALTVKSHSLTPEEVWPVFSVAAVGLFIATGCFIAERLYVAPHAAITMRTSSKHTSVHHAPNQLSSHMVSERPNPPLLSPPAPLPVSSDQGSID